MIRVSVRPSVRLTIRNCTKTAKRGIMQTTPHDGPGILVLGCIRSLRNSDGIIPIGVPNAGVVGKNCGFLPVEKSHFPAYPPYRRKFIFLASSHGCGTIKRNLSKSAFSEEVGHFELKCLVDGDVARNPSMDR